ncbi:hypothetical protein IWW37_004336 [Coemansia sp. RSA 2050]|nr:hypothetical protein IWW37_004336 [Coemansia sp. RSA 2050]
MTEAEDGSSSSQLPPRLEKLPQNARRLGVPQQRPLSQPPAAPMAIGPASARQSVYSQRSQQRDSSSLRARATEILSERTGEHYSPNLSSSPSLMRHELLMERAAVARRVKRHLVTRPNTAAPQPTPAASKASPVPRLSHSLDEPAGLAALYAGSSVLDESGYTGDTNEDYDSNALLAMPNEGPASAYGDDDDDDDDEDDITRQEGVVVNPLLLASGDMTYEIYRWQSKNEHRIAQPSRHGTAASIANSPIYDSLSPLLASARADCSEVAASPPRTLGSMSSRRDSGAAPPLQQQQHRVLGRRRSFSAWESDSDWDLPFRPGQLNVPGGFRRQFVRERAAREGRPHPGIITESFIDFIALYGHFAGGNYLSDDDEEYFDFIQGFGADDASQLAADAEEQTPLVSQHQDLRRRPSGAVQATASSRKAFFLIIKAFVGTGVLVLPRAFYNGGLLTSCVLMLLVAWYAWHCILLLGDVYLRIGGGSYSDIGLRLYGRWMQVAITTSIVLGQIGGCCAYTIFVAQNWRNVFNTLSACKMQLSTEFWVLIQMAVFIPLALIRQIRYFAPVALVANLLIIASLGYLLGFDVWSIATTGPAPFVNYNPARFPLLVGTAVYSFEGVTLVIPILDSLKEKRDFGRVLTLAIMLCLGLFLGVGSLSYLTFGDKVEAVVLLNLPNQSSWTMLVQILYSVAILFSMPLQLFPAVKIMEAMMFTRSGREHKSIKWQKNLFRTATVMLIALIAVFGADQLDNVVSLVGSFCLVPLSFIYPSSMHLKLIANTRWVRFKDSVLIAIGVVAMVYVTFISVATWGTSDPPIDVCI